MKRLNRSFLTFVLLLITISVYGADTVLKLPSGAKRIGLYTGTFDPPHMGHLELILKAKEEFKLDVIYVIPNVSTPHKPGANPYEARRDMAKIAFEGKGIIVGDEIAANIVRKGTVDALVKNIVSKVGSDGKLVKIVGDDSFEYYLKKNDYFSSERMDIAVARRKDGNIPIPDKVGNSKVIKLEVEENGFSSTKVRKEIASGKKPAFLNEKVYKYIVNRGLYNSGPPCHLFQLNLLLEQATH